MLVLLAVTRVLTQIPQFNYSCYVQTVGNFKRINLGSFSKVEYKLNANQPAIRNYNSPWHHLKGQILYTEHTHHPATWPQGEHWVCVESFVALSSASSHGLVEERPPLVSKQLHPSHPGSGLGTTSAVHCGGFRYTEEAASR